MSELKNKFHVDLGIAKRELYADGVARGWFPRNPNTVRTVTVVVGAFLAMAGIMLMMLLGSMFGFGLTGLPVAIGGVALVVLSRAMPRRTAKGRAILHRSLGFAKYVKTAETQQQAFAERANIFTAYLP